MRMTNMTSRSFAHTLRPRCLAYICLSLALLRPGRSLASVSMAIMRFVWNGAGITNPENTLLICVNPCRWWNSMPTRRTTTQIKLLWLAKRVLTLLLVLIRLHCRAIPHLCPYAWPIPSMACPPAPRAMIRVCAASASARWPRCVRCRRTRRRTPWWHGSPMRPACVSGAKRRITRRPKRRCSSACSGLRPITSRSWHWTWTRSRWWRSFGKVCVNINWRPVKVYAWLLADPLRPHCSPYCWPLCFPRPWAISWPSRS